jgi:hypothetical protein
MHRIRKRLTYANVMSSIAVFIVLGGAAYAASQLPKNSVGTKQLKKNAVISSKVKNGSLEAADFKAGQLPAGPKGDKGEKGDPGTPATKLWAVLNGSGTLVRGSGVASAGHPGTGRETVVFNQDVSGCTFLATAGTTSVTDGSGSYPSPGEASVGPLSGNSNGIVVTRSEGGVLENFPVYVAVLC